MKPINIGFNNMVMDIRIIAVINPDSAPSKRLKEEAKLQNRLIEQLWEEKQKL